MSSQINPNNIDGNYPVAGQDNNSQGFRDNFTNTRVNFQAAENEINELQSKGIFKQAIAGTTLDNNMGDNLIYAALIRDFSAVKASPTGVSGVYTLSYSAGHYQTISTTGSVTLAFSNFPPAGQYGLMRLQINITDIAHTLTLPAAVSLGLSGIQGISPGLSGSINTITFGATGYYEFAFGSSDGGSTITLFDLNRALTDFSFADLTLDDINASGYISAVGNVTGGNLRTSGTVSSIGNVIGGNIVTAGTVSSSGNVIGGNIVTTGTVSTTGNVTAVNVNGVIWPTTGTLSQASVRFSSGSLTTNTVAGALEYDGTVFYATPLGGSSASGRGVWLVDHIILTPSAGRVLTQNTSAQAIFDNPTNGEITLTAGMTYLMEGMVTVTNTAAPSASHSYSISFAASGTLSSISYTVDATVSAGAPASGTTTVARASSTAVSALQVTAASTASSEVAIFLIRGVVRSSTSGTFAPQIRFDSNAPGGTSTVAADSYFKLTPVGTASVISVGNWS
jgi:hypothetical protein